METKYIAQLLQNNLDWVKQQLAEDELFFERSSQGQSPNILWLGCSDSRVLPNEMTGTSKGELFVHRNIANLVINTDLNFLSALQYGVEYLKVKHIVVCGHYNCGGVQAAMTDKSYGIIDNWIRPIKDTLRFYEDDLNELDEKFRFDRLVELNVIEQINHLGLSNTVRNSWREGQELHLHSWVYDIHTGIIKVIAPIVSSEETLKNICKFERIRREKSV